MIAQTRHGAPFGAGRGFGLAAMGLPPPFLQDRAEEGRRQGEIGAQAKLGRHAEEIEEDGAGLGAGDAGGFGEAGGVEVFHGSRPSTALQALRIDLAFGQDAKGAKNAKGLR